MTIKFRKAISAIALAVVVTLAPASSAVAQAYTVVKGDSLSKIAQKHNTNWKTLFKKNAHIADPHLIYPGQAIEIAVPGEAVPERPVEAPQPVAAPAPAPEPAPAPAPAPVAQTTAALTGCELARSLINQYDWNTDVAYQVMVAESSCNPNAVNMADDHGSCSGSFGLFQINCGHGQLYDPAANVAEAYKMYQARGWAPWGFTTCKTKVVCT